MYIYTVHSFSELVLESAHFTNFLRATDALGVRIFRSGAQYFSEEDDNSSKVLRELRNRDFPGRFGSVSLVLIRLA